MNNLINKYTEERYASRQKLNEQFSGAIADTIWKEIILYRRNFIYSDALIYPYEFCLCAGILKKLTALKEKYSKYRINEFTLEMLIEMCGYLIDENWLIMILQYQNRRLSLDEAAKELNKQFPIETKEKWAELIKDERLPIECRWIVLFSQCESKEYACLLFLISAYEYGIVAEALKAIEYLLSVEYYKDSTYALQGMMDYLLNCTMIKMEKKDRSYNDLICQYPPLKDYQLKFYLEHCTSGYYYTVKQFISYAEVSRETARCALEQLVQLNFYVKLKKGKKFVYTCP